MIYLSVTISYPSTQFEELYRPFINLRTHLPLKDNSPFNFLLHKNYSPFQLSIKSFTLFATGIENACPRVQQFSNKWHLIFHWHEYSRPR